MKKEYDPFYSLVYENELSKANHRRSRKAKLKKTARVIKPSLNNSIGKIAASYGKKMLHRFNRRNWKNTASQYYKVTGYCFNDIAQAIT